MSQRKTEKNKKYDILVWGATGYTGTLIAEYLAKNAPDHITFAIGGRNEEKLKEIKKNLMKLTPKSEEVGVLVGNSENQSTIDAVVQQTRVVINASGPFRLYAPPVVDACVRFGVDYCDITGEVSWCKYVIDKYHDAAKEKGVLIIPTCGFDSLPSDIGTLFLLDYVKRTYSVNCKSVSFLVEKIAGAASGGTFASAANEMKYAGGNRDPYGLVPVDQKPSLAQPKDFSFIGYNSPTKNWTVPFVMAFINTRVVHRTHALIGYKYGQFQYSEKMGFRSLLKAVIVGFFIYLSMVIFFIPFTRKLALKYLLPKPGEGPKRETLTKGEFRVALVAELLPSKQKEEIPKNVVARISATGDIGYYLTSIMIGEVGLALVDKKSLPPVGGVLTPGSGIGLDMHARLREKGFKFTIVDK